MSAAVRSLLDGDIAANPPPGFAPLRSGEGFNVLFGPVFGRFEDDRLILGFRVTKRHVNPHETCHGGALATFADFQGFAAQHAAKTANLVTPTISMTIDFLAPARFGDWIESRTDLLRATRTMLFSQTVAAVGYRKVFRSSCVFKIGRPAAHPGSTIEQAFADGEDHP